MFLFSLLVPSGTRDKRHPPKLTWRSQQGDDTGRRQEELSGYFGPCRRRGSFILFPLFFFLARTLYFTKGFFYITGVAIFPLLLPFSSALRRFWNHCTGTPYNPLKNTPGHRAQTLKIANHHLLLPSGSEKRPVLCMYSVQSKSPRGTPYVVPSSGRSLRTLPVLCPVPCTIPILLPVERVCCFTRHVPSPSTSTHTPVVGTRQVLRTPFLADRSLVCGVRSV